MTSTDPAGSANSPEPADTGSPTADELRRAMKAFKKRLKLARLDDESRLGRGAMTGGARSSILEIASASYLRAWRAAVRVTARRILYSTDEPRSPTHHQAGDPRESRPPEPVR